MAEINPLSSARLSAIDDSHLSIWKLSKLFGALALVVVTSVAYYPAMHGPFIMDDDGLLTESSIIKAHDGLARFWFTDEPDDYWPLTNSSLWLEWRLWGGNPTGYHITNLALHVASALVLCAILQQLAIPGAFLAALLFAVHPVNVESIAWIAQRKNALAMFFFLLSILSYLSAEARRGNTNESQKMPIENWFWYALSLLTFILSMLSKGSVAVLPMLLLLIVWWRYGRIGLGDLARTAPFFLVAIGLTGVNLWFQTHGSGAVIRDVTFAQRLAGAGAAVWFYLSKALLPIELLFVYPPWDIQTKNLLWWIPLFAAAFVTIVLWTQRNAADAGLPRAILFAWLFFGIALAPVLGFTDVGFMKYSLVADHYQHISIIGVVALVAAAWSLSYSGMPGPLHSMFLPVAVVVVGALAWLTWHQNQNYGNPVALYETTLEKNPTCWMAHNNLGLALVKQKRYQDAIDHYREAVRIKSDFPEALNNWGAALNRANQSQEAIQRLQEALRMKFQFPIAHNNLASALRLQNRLPEAIKEYQIAVQMKPDYAEAFYNLALALADAKQIPQAIESYQHAIRLKPEFPEAEFNLAVTLDLAGRSPEAIDHYRRATQLNPDFAEAFNSFGAALSGAGRPQEAIVQLQQAVKLLPDSAAAHNNLGIALTRTDRAQEGIEQFHEALRLKPDYAEAHLNLGIALSKVGQLQDGIEEFKKTIAINPDSINAYTNMTKAYVMLQRPADAIASAEKALELARAQGNTAIAGDISEWLKSYRSEQSGSASSPQTKSDRGSAQP